MGLTSYLDTGKLTVMFLLVVNSLAAYTAWGIVSSLIPVIRRGPATWRLPSWLRALAIAGIAFGLHAAPPRYVHALAAAAIVLFLVMAALKLGAALPEPYEIILSARGKHPEPQEARGYSPARSGPGRRVPRID